MGGVTRKVIKWTVKSLLLWSFSPSGVNTGHKAKVYFGFLSSHVELHWYHKLLNGRGPTLLTPPFPCKYEESVYLERSSLNDTAQLSCSPLLGWSPEYYLSPSADPLRRPSGCDSELEETLVDLPGLLFFSLFPSGISPASQHLFDSPLASWLSGVKVQSGCGMRTRLKQISSLHPVVPFVSSATLWPLSQHGDGIWRHCCVAPLFRDRSTLVHSWLNSEDEVTGKCSSLCGVTVRNRSLPPTRETKNLYTTGSLEYFYLFAVLLCSLLEK